MKQRIIILLTINLLFCSGLFAQDIEKMNKSELRDYIIYLKNNIDSKTQENINLQESINRLSEKSSLLEKNNKENELEISRLNESIVKNENEIKRLKSEYESKALKLNEEISTLNELVQKKDNEIKQLKSENETIKLKLNAENSNLTDSNSGVGSSSDAFSTSTTFNNTDFLNKYYFDQVPLPNNSFSLVLTKLVYGSVEIIQGNYYSDGNAKGGVIKLPELLDPSAFTYWGLKPNLDTRNKSFNDLVHACKVDYLNSKLPKIEILKNKLFTLKYTDGTEESFLFNVKKNQSNDVNNQRGILQLDLANEEVKSDGGNNTAKDMVWRFFVIGDECYLALSLNQLNRIGLMLSQSNSIEYIRNGQTRDDGYFKNEGYSGLTTGRGIYLSRNKDSFMGSSNYIDPKELIYLFKLK
jgi:hypothetical protein